jgi:hypothetical protein
MHIDHDNLVLHTEGDVESKLLIPLLSSELYLGIPSQNLFSKEYLAPAEVDKGAKVLGGYYPTLASGFMGFLSYWLRQRPPGFRLSKLIVRPPSTLAI